jgi:hypothetical protein
MAKQSIGLGSVADDGTGDTLRIAGDKVNDNFDEIYTALGDGSTLSLPVTAINNATANELVTIGATTTELDAEANLTFDGSTLTVTGNITVPNDGDIGSVGATDAIQISSAGIITFKDDIKIKDGGTIGTATDADAVTIAAAGAVTFSQRSVHSSGITIDTGGSRTSSGQTENIIITNSNLTGDDTGIHMTAGNTGNSTIRFGAPSDDTLASILVTNATTSATLKLAAGNGNTNLTLSGTAGSESAVFAGTVKLTASAGTVKRDGTAAFLVIESGGTDGAGTDAGDNIIDETDSDDIILEDQIFHHTGHSSVSLTIFDSGGAVVKSLIGVHQDTSELN